MDMPRADATDKDLALWMLARMRDSETVIGVIKAARGAGRRDVLDSPEYVTRHTARLKKLYQADSEDDTPVSASTAAKIEAVMKRDLLSSREELIEKAIASYIAQHPDGALGLPVGWQTTFDAARDEIEGRTAGAFEPDFAGSLAATARQDMTREAEVTVTRDQGLERD